MKLTRRLQSPPFYDEPHGLYCRTKAKLKPKWKTRRKFVRWGERAEAFFFKVRKPHETQYTDRLAKMPENYSKYYPNYNAEIDRKNVEIDRKEAVARAHYDKKEDDKLQELETKRFMLDKKIDRQANKMRWERQTRRPIEEVEPRTPSEHIRSLSLDGACDEADVADKGTTEPEPTIKDDVKKILDHIKSRRHETPQEREERHGRERERTTTESQAAHRTLLEHGISVRDFQIEHDRKKATSMFTDEYGREIETQAAFLERICSGSSR